MGLVNVTYHTEPKLLSFRVNPHISDCTLATTDFPNASNSCIVQCRVPTVFQQKDEAESRAFDNAQ